MVYSITQSARRRITKHPRILDRTTVTSDGRIYLPVSWNKRRSRLVYPTVTIRTRSWIGARIRFGSFSRPPGSSHSNRLHLSFGLGIRREAWWRCSRVRCSFLCAPPYQRKNSRETNHPSIGRRSWSDGAPVNRAHGTWVRSERDARVFCSKADAGRPGWSIRSHSLRGEGSPSTRGSWTARRSPVTGASIFLFLGISVALASFIRQ